MAQQRLKDFFGVKASFSGSQSPIDLTFAEKPYTDKIDKISFHSFTVHRSLDGRKLMDTMNDDSTTAMSDTRVRPRKISDFNEYMLDRELAAMSSTVAFENNYPLEQAHKSSGRDQPDVRCQSKPIKHTKTPKLDDYFISRVAVNEVLLALHKSEENLGKRGFNGEITNKGEKEPQKVLVIAPKKGRPMDKFVVRIQRNTPANCNL